MWNKKRAQLPNRRRGRFLAVVGIILLVLLVLVAEKNLQQRSRVAPPPEPLSLHSEEFPSQTLEYFDATAVHPQALGFQLADYDPESTQAIFYPWGGQPAPPLGVILSYHTDRDFFDASSYEAVDLTQLIAPEAEGFGTGCIDSSHKWIYLPANKKDTGRGVEANTLMIRYDTDKPISSRDAYETFDLADLGISRIGWVTCAEVNGYTYFTPTVDEDSKIPHGVLLRYNNAKAFTDASSWEWYDTAKHVHRRLKGFQSAAAHLPYVYLIPYGLGESMIVRYDTRKSFSSASSYETFEIAQLHSQLRGPTGGIIVRDTLVLVPWRDLSRPRGKQAMSVAAAFDTRKALNDPSAWKFIDLTQVHPHAKGYQFGWADRDGFVHFVPTANFEIGKPPPFIVWDSSRPFDDPASWHPYDNPTSPPSTGAAYDPATNTAWLAPYGGERGKLSGLITKVRMRYEKK